MHRKLPWSNHYVHMCKWSMGWTCFRLPVAHCLVAIVTIKLTCLLVLHKSHYRAPLCTHFCSSHDHNIMYRRRHCQWLADGLSSEFQRVSVVVLRKSSNSDYFASDLHLFFGGSQWISVSSASSTECRSRHLLQCLPSRATKWDRFFYKSADLQQVPQWQCFAFRNGMPSLRARHCH